MSPSTVASSQDHIDSSADPSTRTKQALPEQPADANSPTSTLPATKGEGLRASPRYMVDWKIALVFGEGTGKLTFRGRTFDLSMHGTAMLTHANVFSKSPVTILLAPPPLRRVDSNKVIEIQAQQAYSVYSGSLSCFRLGFKFIRFKGDGKHILEDMLSHYQPSLYTGAR